MLGLRAGKIDREITPERTRRKISITDAHLGRFGAQDSIAVQLVTHPPVERGLWTAARIDDLFRISGGVSRLHNTCVNIRSV